jgi:hypothetical protein
MENIFKEYLMKKFKRILIGAVALSVILMNCATTKTESESTPLTVGPDESIVVVQRKKTAYARIESMKIYIDDEYKTSIANGKTARIIVPNGEHLIWAGSTTVDRSRKLPFTVQSEEITFFASPRIGGVLSTRFELIRKEKKEL